MQMSRHLTLVGRVASGLNGLLGACIMLSPVLLGYATHHDSDVWASLVIGGVLMIFGMTRLISPEELPLLSWLNLALGACVILSPWLFRFAADETRMWTAVALGGVVMVLAALSARVTLLLRQRVYRAI
jgi:hypothetical protein